MSVFIPCPEWTSRGPPYQTNQSTWGDSVTRTDVFSPEVGRSTKVLVSSLHLSRRHWYYSEKLSGTGILRTLMSFGKTDKYVSLDLFGNLEINVKLPLGSLREWRRNRNWVNVSVSGRTESRHLRYRCKQQRRRLEQDLRDELEDQRVRRVRNVDWLLSDVWSPSANWRIF